MRAAGAAKQAEVWTERGESEAVAAAFASGGVEWGESVGCNTPFVFPSAPEGGRGEFVRVGGTCRGLARAVECGNERKAE